jgi:hypothetical protein
MLYVASSHDPVGVGVLRAAGRSLLHCFLLLRTAAVTAGVTAADAVPSAGIWQQQLQPPQTALASS